MAGGVDCVWHHAMVEKDGKHEMDWWHLRYEPRPLPPVAEEDVEKPERNLFNRWFVKAYLDVLLSPPGMIVTTILFIMLLGFSAWKVDPANIPLGFELVQAIPPGTLQYNALVTRNRDFSLYPFFILTGIADYSTQEVQQNLFKVWSQYNAISYAIHDSGTPWILMMVLWALPSTPRHTNAKYGRYCDSSNRLVAGKCGETFNCVPIVNDTSLLQGKLPFFAQQDFYRCLITWLNTDLIVDNINPAIPLLDSSKPRGQRQLKYVAGSNNTKLAYSTGVFLATGLKENKDYVAMIQEVLKVSGSDLNPPIFASGIPIDYWTQYLDLVPVITGAIIYSLIIVFVITAFVTFLVVEYDPGTNPLLRVLVAIWGSMFTTLGVGMCVLFLYGFTIHAGATISSIPAVSIIMAAGVGVEFCAYIVLTFQRQHGTKRERIYGCLDIMFAPNVDGCITMFLGVVLLNTSQFPFVVLYFFLVWMLLIVFCLLVSMMFLPVFLVLGGPPNIHSDATRGKA